MRREQTKQIFKLRLLAFVLVLALLWYSLNPAPSPVSRYKPEEDLPDEKRRELEPQLQRVAALPGALGTLERGMAASSASDEDRDDFEWPEFIDA